MTDKDKNIEKKKTEVKLDTSKTSQKPSTKKQDSNTKTLELKPVPKDSSYGTGKRKSAIAKVWIFKGSGEYVVNKKALTEYLPSYRFIKSSLKPLELLGLEKNYDVRVSAIGGGLSAQADAISLGIARALVDLDENFRDKLKYDLLLRRDARIKERKKYGRKRARKSFTYRKR